MHRNQCVHRDLKLENMLLTDHDVVKICDFGWSAEMEIEKMLKTTCGTTAYWAPEIWESAPQDESVDMWMLGCMLYEMLAGHAPFHEQDQTKLKQKVLSVEFGYPPWFSNEACHTVHILLQRNPAHRVKCEDLLKHPWLSKYKEQGQQPVAEALNSEQAVGPTVEPASSKAGVTQTAGSRPQNLVASLPPSAANGRSSSLVARSGPSRHSAPQSEAAVPTQPQTQPLASPGPTVDSWRESRRLEAPRVSARVPGETSARAPGEPLLSFTGTRPSAAPTSPVTRSLGSTMVSQAMDSAMTAPTTHSRRFASPARNGLRPVSRSTSPMHRVDPLQGNPTIRLEAVQAASTMSRWDASQQVNQFGFESQEQPTWSSGIQTYGGATGSLGSAALRAGSPNREWDRTGFATEALGSAVVSQSPTFGGGSGSVLLQQGGASRDVGNSWRGARTSVPSRHLPPTASSTQGYVSAPTTLLSGVPQWHSMPGRDYGRDYAGVSLQPVSNQRLPAPQPVASVAQTTTAVTHTRANLASTPTSTARTPTGITTTTYGLPHSSSGRLAPLGSFMVMPQQQQLGYGSVAFGASPRSALVS